MSTAITIAGGFADLGFTIDPLGAAIPQSDAERGVFAGLQSAINTSLRKVGSSTVIGVDGKIGGKTLSAAKEIASKILPFGIGAAAAPTSSVSDLAEHAKSFATMLGQRFGFAPDFSPISAPSSAPAAPAAPVVALRQPSSHTALIAGGLLLAGVAAAFALRNHEHAMAGAPVTEGRIRGRGVRCRDASGKFAPCGWNHWTR